jgi:tetratricopeptide (TPR) repeat protein
MKSLKIITTLLLFLICSVTQAKSTQEQLKIIHPQFDKPLLFNVTLPSGYEKNTDKSYLMMFDFHPNADTYLRGMHDWLSHNGEWPWLQTIIVTPAPGNRVGMLFDETGKTTPLLDFFEKKLFAEIDKKYRTNGFKIMSGFRVNGTIVLSMLLKKPELVNAYIAISPELKDNYVGIISSAKNMLKKLNDKPRYLLLSHGSTVKEDHQIDSYKQLKEILKSHSPSELDWRYQHFSDSYFMSLPLLSTILAIENIFDDIHQGLAPQSSIAQQGVQAIIDHYDYLSNQKYGFEVSPKDSIDTLGFYLLNSSHEEGIKVLKKSAQLFPTKLSSQHNLAKAYAKIGNFEKAVYHQKQAVKISETMQTWYQKRNKRILIEYQQKLSEFNSNK